MITKNEIAKIAKQILKRQRGLRDHQIIHPTREWFVGLAFSLIILIGGATWSILTYLEVSGRTVETTPTEAVTANVYRGDIVTAALAKFRERTDNFNQLLQNRIQVTPAEPEEIAPEAEPTTSDSDSASSTETVADPVPVDSLNQVGDEVATPEAELPPVAPPVIPDDAPIDFN